jgi:CxxC-x17-CxxC domain-containing protein
MNEGKILLVNVSKGRIGEDNSALLGAMIITKIQLAAMERIKVPEEERVDFYLYVDEFQNFATDSFASILSEARKYRLALIIAHQYIGQLVTDTSTKVRDAIFGNAGTIVAFRTGAADAEFLEKEFAPDFELQDLVNLPNRTIVLKLVVNGVSSRPFSASTLPPFDIATVPDIEKKVIDASRKQYARPRWLIEEEINKWSGTAFSKPGYMITCSLCGKETTVPFQPEEGRPVYCQSCILKVRANSIKPEGGATRVEINRDGQQRQFVPRQNSDAPREHFSQQKRTEDAHPRNDFRETKMSFHTEAPTMHEEKKKEYGVLQREAPIKEHEIKRALPFRDIPPKVEEKTDLLDAIDKAFLSDIPESNKKEEPEQNIHEDVQKHIAHTEEKHRQYQGFTKNYKERKPKQEPNRDDLRTALSDALKKQPPH